ncbi:MAG: diguanylate cyclase [Wenzhouxiangella sp.]|nr:diguanylate cyclase [Wenzhouxiangella sp.]
MVVATWQNAPGWPLSYISENVGQFGYKADELMVGRPAFIDLVHPDDHVINERQLHEHLESGPDVLQQTYRFRHADGHWLWIDDHSWLIRAEDGQVQEIQGVLMDVSRTRRAELMNTAQVRLMERAENCALKELLQSFLDEAELLTDSSIGFYHFIDEDQTRLELQAWSSNTRQRMCQTEPDATHYPVDQAGVWADAVRRRDAVIHNDYAALPCRRGLPPGHARIERELVVPVLRKDRIVAILGVGNKLSNYNQQDVESVRELADFAWEIVARKRAQAALEARSSELERMAHFDPLTGLPNRTLLTDRLQQAVAQATRRGSLLAVAFLDLDGFKAINDQHGHAAGDFVLSTLGRRLKHELRAGDTVARLGGDEFVIVMVDFDQPGELHSLLDRVLATVNESLQLPESDTTVQTGASIGITLFQNPSEVDAGQLLRQADQAMYQAKLAGKNRCHFFA